MHFVVRIALCEMENEISFLFVFQNHLNDYRFLDALLKTDFHLSKYWPTYQMTVTFQITTVQQIHDVK